MKTILLFLFLITSLLVKTNSKIITNTTIETLDFYRGAGAHKYQESQLGLQTYEVNMHGCTDCYYVHFKITSYTEKMQNILLYFSSSDPLFKEGRELMNHASAGPVEMCVKQEQFTGDDKKFYIGVECPTDETCTYYLEANNENKCTINYMKKLSYFVATDNINKTSILLNDISLYDNKNDDNIVITIWVKSFLNNAIIELKDISQYTILEKKINYVTAFNIYGNSALNAITIHVDTKVGDDITFGSSINVDSEYLNNLYPNDPQVTVYLNKENNSKVCFPVSFNELISYDENDQFEIFLYFYNGIGEFYLKDKSGVESNKKIIDAFTDTIIFKYSELTNNFICISIPEEEKYNVTDIIFDIKIIDTKNLVSVNDENIYYLNYIDVYEPQFNYLFYKRNLYSGKISIFNSIKPNVNASEYSFAIKTLKGDCQMYFDKCTTYPKCNYDNLDNLDQINNIGDIYSFNIKNEGIEFTPISPIQNFIIVKCNENKNIYNSFESVFFDNIDYLILKENESFKQYLISQQTNQYKILYSTLIDSKQIMIEVQIINGDINLILKNELIEQKFQTANKIFYLMNLNNNQGDVIISIKSLKNTVYSIKYNKISNNLNEYIENDLNYLVTLDKTENNKLLYYTNPKNSNNNYLINFYSLNCNLELYKQLNDGTFSKLSNIDYYYSQDIITNSDDRYKNENYIYKIAIQNEEDITINNKKCMLYTSANELQSHQNEINPRKHIVLNENNPQKIIFNEKNNNIQLLYVHTNIAISVMLDIILYNKVEYSVVIYFNNKATDKKYTIKNNENIYLTNNDWKNYCTDQTQPCNILVDILLNSNYNNEDQLMQISLRKISNSPTYIQKNNLLESYSNGEKYMFYYTEIGQNNIAEITYNNLINNGKIFASIVEKNKSTPDKNPDWMGIFEFPKNEESSLEYNEFYKKIYISADDTKNCADGCFILITIKASIDDTKYNSENYLYPFTLKINTKNDNNDISTILTNQNIFGNINYDSTNNNINIYYKLWIPEDAESLIFDYHSEQVNLYINIGDEKPTLNKYDFIYEPKSNKDSLFILTKENILEKAEVVPYANSIKYVKLFIGLYAKQPDNFYENFYTFNVYLKNEEKNNKLNIYNINQNQQISCKTSQINNSNLYRCLFVMIYSDIKINNELVLYPLVNEVYDMHAEYIDKDLIKNLEYEKLSVLIPDEQSTFSTVKTGEKYLYVQNGIENKYLFINIVTEKETSLTLINSLYSNLNNIIKPNPFITELINTKKESLTINFNNEHKFIVNILSLMGNAQIYWENSPDKIYYLNETSTNIVLLSEKTDNLIIKNLNTGASLSFYLSYSMSNDNYNIEKINNHNNVKFNFRNDFPLYFYSQLNDNNNNNDLVISYNLYDLIQKNSISDELITDKIFEINAYILTEEEIIKLKNNPEKEIPKDKTKSIKGVYDNSLQAGYIFITKSQFANIENPFVFTVIEKTDEKITFSQINVETAINEINIENNLLSENVHYYGQLNLGDNKFVNNKILIKSRKSKYIRLIFSTNSKYLDWCVNVANNVKSNYTFEEFESVYENGKSIITFKLPEPKNYREIFLNVFSEHSSSDIRLNNYVIKYVTSINKLNLIDYNIKNNDADIIINSNNTINNKTSIIFNPINLATNDLVKITYLLKIVPNDTYIIEEFNSTIAISESPNIIAQFDNPKIEEDGKIKIEVENFPLNYNYTNIIAKINYNSIIDFISYNAKCKEITPPGPDPGPDPKPDPEPEPDPEPQPDPGETNKALIIIVLCIVATAVLIFIVYFVVSRFKNKGRLTKLQNDVENISFNKSDRKSGFFG